MKINELRPLEHNFTEVLKKLVLIPKMLYYYGNLPVLGADGKAKRGSASGAVAAVDSLPNGRPKCVAIVGARRNTAYGKEVAYRAAYEAAKAGAVVVSGLAYGIDSIAHRGALDAGGITVAVLGTPIDRIYPRAHTGLVREIVESGGVVISEYGPGEEAEGGQHARMRFLERNRIIAGLADVVLIAEAAERSGSLNTAMHAADAGVELLAVPGDIMRTTSAGCNRLISQGVTPYLAPEDLLQMLFPAPAKKRITDAEKLARLAQMADDETEMGILGCLALGVQDGDEIIARARISPDEFARAMTMLEIKGAVKSLGANTWMVRDMV